MQTIFFKLRFKSASTFIAKTLTYSLFFILIAHSTIVRAQSIVVGTYTGNGGTPFNVTGLGFTPVCVLVQKANASVSFIASNTMGALTKVNAANALAANYITSFGSGYFTVGSSSDANASSTTYYYTAFSSNAVTVGTFVGGASDQNITVGFKPKMVWAMPADATWPTQSQMNLVDYEANSFKMEGGGADWEKEVLGAYGATTFTARSRANSGVTYHYVAFKYGKTGTYTGNATTRSIVTGVGSHPAFVFAKDQGIAPGATSWYKTTSMPTNNSYRFNGANSTLQITAIGNDGFDLGTSTDANASGSASQWFALDADDILPVELLSFAGKKGLVQNHLYWQTASEIKSAYFIVERSSDGERYSTIGRVEAAGTSTALLNYAFNDEAPLAANNYYRLMQVDDDGAFVYSKSIVLANDVVRNALTLYPNPVQGQLHLLVQSAVACDALVEVYDGIGQLLKQQQFILSKGDNTLLLDVADLADACYTLRLVGNTSVAAATLFCKH